MGQYAKLNEYNIVITINELDDSNIDNLEAFENSLSSLYGGYTWKKTKMDSNYRGKYAAIGDIYDPNIDAFYKEQPYPSWTLNTNSYNWEPPIPYPTQNFNQDNKPLDKYNWNEENQVWDLIN